MFSGGTIMEYESFDNKYIMRIDRGEEIIETIREFCKENNITLGTISGLGAVDQARIGLFNTKTKEYHAQTLEGDHEITSLSGNISTMDGEVYLHVHANLADDKYNTYGGHLNEAVVSGTGEIVIEEIEGQVDREFSNKIGLNLYDFQQ